LQTGSQIFLKHRWRPVLHRSTYPPYISYMVLFKKGGSSINDRASSCRLQVRHMANQHRAPPKARTDLPVACMSRRGHRGVGCPWRLHYPAQLKATSNPTPFGPNTPGSGWQPVAGLSDPRLPISRSLVGPSASRRINLPATVLVKTTVPPPSRQYVLTHSTPRDVISLRFRWAPPA